MVKWVYGVPVEYSNKEDMPLTVTEAAGVANISTEIVYRAISSGRLAFTEILLNRYMTTRSDVRRWRSTVRGALPIRKW